MKAHYIINEHLRKYKGSLDVLFLIYTVNTQQLTHSVGLRYYTLCCCAPESILKEAESRWGVSTDSASAEYPGQVQMGVISSSEWTRGAGAGAFSSTLTGISP